MKKTDVLIFARAFSDETRQQIMRLICCKELPVGEIAAHTRVSQPTVSHHLAILREAGLVLVREEGKQTYYALNQERVSLCCGELQLKFAPDLKTQTNEVPLEEK
jgi:ArsR family transcriptional regulator